MRIRIFASIIGISISTGILGQTNSIFLREAQAVVDNISGDISTPSYNGKASSDRLLPGEGLVRPVYESGRIIVKFSPEVGEKVYEAQDKGGFKKVLPQAESLDSLNQLYGAHDIRRVFQFLETRNTQGEVTGFTTARDRAQEVDERFFSRAQRTAPGKGIPDLENIFIVELGKSKDVLTAVEAYSHDPNVVYAQPNYQAKALDSDPYFFSSNSWGQGYDDQWPLKADKMDLPAAWIIAPEAGSGVIVAVVDTGVDYAHTDIDNNMWTDMSGYHGYDFVSNDHYPMDDYGHGTHVAGAVGAELNYEGIRGMAYDTKIMATKGLNHYGIGYIETLADCIQYAADNGADVINNSWGTYMPMPYNQLLEETIEYAAGRGCLVVFAAGNNSHFRDDVYYFSPQNHPDVMTVAATDYNDQIALFSFAGNQVAVATPGSGTPLEYYLKPGRDILSLRAAGTDMYGDEDSIVGTHFYRAQGTSMSAPYACGIAALILSHYPWYTLEEVRALISKCVDPIENGAFGNGDAYIGNGRANAALALDGDPVVAQQGSQITFPDEGDIFNSSSIVSIQGSALGASYTLEIFSNPTSLYGGYPLMLLGQGDTVVDGNLASWSTSGWPSGDYYLKLVVVDELGWEYVDIKKVRIDNDLLQGWPKRLEEPIYSSPLVADFDGNGDKEVFAATENGRLHLFDADGTIYPGWPISLPPGFSPFDSTPAVFDLDQDGNMEIILNKGSAIVVLHHNGVLAWSRNYGVALTAGSVSVGDINGDFQPDIIYPYVSPDRTLATIRVLDKNGNTLSPWPFEFSGSNLDMADMTAGLADFDQDNDDDIAVVFADTPAGGNKTVYAYVLNQSKVPLPGWPQAIVLNVSGLVGHFDRHGRLAISDVDADGEQELFQGIAFRARRDLDGYMFDLDVSRVYGFNHDGTLMDDWGLVNQGDEYFYTWPARIENITLADLFGDGRLEIIMHSNCWQGHVVFVAKHENWASDYWMRAIGDFSYDIDKDIRASSVVVGSIDGLAVPDIVVGSPNLNRISAFRRNGVAIRIGIEGYNERQITKELMQGRIPFVGATPTITDLNQDGKTDLVVGGVDGRLYVWDLHKNFHPETLVWPMFHGNLHHSGSNSPGFQYLVGSDYPTIQSAIDAAPNKSIILVPPGTYTEHITVENKTLYLKGIDGPEQTIIDGGGNGRPLRLSFGEYIIDGFTITHGYADATNWGGGGGIYLDRGLTTIKNCKIVNNIASEFGGGVVDGQGDPHIVNTLIANNTVENGGGGAIYLLGSRLKLTNSTIAGNNATYDSAIAGEYASVESENSIIRAGTGPGRVISIIYSIDPPEEFPPLRYSDIEGLEDYAYIPGEGNIDADPRFVDAAAGNYRLDFLSPCTDRADGDVAPYDDLNGSLRYDDRGIENRGIGEFDFVDIGAYERQTDTPLPVVDIQMDEAFVSE